MLFVTSVLLVLAQLKQGPQHGSTHAAARLNGHGRL